MQKHHDRHETHRGLPGSGPSHSSGCWICIVTAMGGDVGQVGTGEVREPEMLAALSIGPKRREEPSGWDLDQGDEQPPKGLTLCSL
jgi:hypothetical protein